MHTSIRKHSAKFGGTTPLTIIDTRGLDEYAAGHFQDAWHIPGNELASRLRVVPRNRSLATYWTMCHKAPLRASGNAAPGAWDRGTSAGWTVPDLGGDLTCRVVRKHPCHT
jgi:hypothetical protein